jgi:hypothetical protein
MVLRQIFNRAGLFFIPVIFLMALHFVTGCANIIPPGGGPRDSIAPALVSATPPDSTINFSGNRIVLTFDEYIDLQDIQNNLLFTPTFEQNPKIEARAKTITIPFKDSLLPNTTYILNFGNAIRDVNEGNPLKNFVYTFSTGPVIDTLEIAGKLTLAETGGVDSTVIIVLHSDLSDSAVKKRPVYIARVDANGNFRFTNLPNRQFAIYALGDPVANDRRYQAGTQLFAFANAPVRAGQSEPVTLYAYRQQPPAAATNPSPIATPRVGSDRRLQFSTNLSGNQQDISGDLVLNFQTPLRQFDSAMLSLSTDSSYTPAPFSARLDSSRKALSIQSNWTGGKAYHLVLNRDFAEDTAGRKLLKTDTLHFTTRKLSDYGSLSLRVRNIEVARRPVLLFLQNDRVVFSAPIQGSTFSKAMFTPGEYQLRVLYDTNGNGRWDPGSFFGLKRQPEIVRPIARTIVVKAGLDNEFDIGL